MAANIHLRNLDHVKALAEQRAIIEKQDQAIYKTKDINRYEIFQVIPAYLYKGNAVAIVRYTGEDTSSDVLQDHGVERPDDAITDTGTDKRKRHGKTKRNLEQPSGLLLQKHEQAELGELSSEHEECHQDSE